MNRRGLAVGSAVALLAAIVAIVAVVVLSGGSSSPRAGAAGTASSSQPPVPAGYTGLNDPALQACMAAKRVCNPAAAAELSSQPFASAPNAGAALISRAEAVAAVEKGLPAVTSAQLANAPTYSALMTGTQANSTYGIGRSTNVNEAREVWVVTVIAPVKTDGAPGAAPQTKNAYSAVVDAASGLVTDDCIGCSWLTASQ